jgi:hypothetical protein
MAKQVIDLEFGDGDEVVALSGIDGRILAMKRRSLVLLQESSSLGYEILSVTKGYGISSADTLCQFEDRLYWLDYNGVMVYTTRGIEVINNSWLVDLLAIDDATKEAAKAVMDMASSWHEGIHLRPERRPVDGSNLHPSTALLCD